MVECTGLLIRQTGPQFRGFESHRLHRFRRQIGFLGPFWYSLTADPAPGRKELALCGI